MTDRNQISGDDILAEEEHHIPATEFEFAVRNEMILVFTDATSAMQDKKVVALLRKVEGWAKDNCGRQPTVEQPLLHVAFSTRGERDAFKAAVVEQTADGQESGWSYVPIVNVYIIDNTTFFYALAFSIVCG